MEQPAKLFVSAALLTFFLSFTLSLECLNSDGKSVDWYIVYKLPHLKSSKNPVIRDGFGYYYMDVDNPQWNLGHSGLNATDHAIFYTLQQIYKSYSSDDIMYAFYNDETPPKNVSFTNGHTKGVVGFDSVKGFWLVHSLPRFPPEAKSGYGYPYSGTYFGQTFLCISMAYKFLNVIGEQLMYTYPQTYDSSLPTKFAEDNPKMSAAMKGQHVTSPPWSNVVQLTSLGDQSFTSFAKFTKFDADLYDRLVAPRLGGGLDVESWQNGGHKTPSNCTAKYKVQNIQAVKVSDVAFDESADHAKWAVTLTGNWLCIGDINRMDSQRHRAGGTVCGNIPAAWRAFHSSITKVEACAKPQVLLNQV